MLKLQHSPAKFVVTLFICAICSSLRAQELKWAFSNGGHLTERAWGVEKVPGGVVFLSSAGLEKRSEAGEQLWRFDFFDLDAYRYSPKPGLSEITVDEDGNIYAELTFPATGPGSTTISNIDIPHGNSIIKINSEGKLLWARKITGSRRTRVAYHQGSIYAIGLFNDTLNIDDTYIFKNIENTACGDSYESRYAEDIFISKWNTIGQLQGGVQLGEAAYDQLKAVTIDEKGNIYLAVDYGKMYCTPNENRIYKIGPNLETLWSKTIVKEYEEGNGTGLLYPTDLFVGPNNKLYYWCYVSGKVYTDNIRITTLATYGSAAALVEFNASDGSFLNYRFFDGFSIFGQRGYMAYYKNHLLVATSFRETQEFDNGSLTTVNDGEEPVVIKVNLNNFKMEYLMHLSGIPQQYHNAVNDWSGPVRVNLDEFYYSGSFSSDTLNLNPNVALYNNSGNNAQDYFLTKYDLGGVDFTASVEDSDQDGVQNWMDLCPETPLGEVTDEHGCSLAEKDTDLDGVTDDLDICPDTPPGVPIDVDGCSQDQIDTDGDGVPNFRDSCPDTAANVLVGEQGCELVIIDSNLFQIETFGEACKDAENGSIHILTQDNSRVYRAVLNGSEEIPFTGDTHIQGLKAGQYELCILAHEVDSDMLCYTLTIASGTEISLGGKVDLSARTLSLELSGGTVYKINFNGQLLETTQSSLELDLHGGLNQVQVTTDRSCQGMAMYTVDMGSGIRISPNPFTDKIDLTNMYNSKIDEVHIYTQNGQQVYQKTFGPNEPVLLQDVSHLTAGTYILEYAVGNSRFSQKIIKR